MKKFITYILLILLIPAILPGCHNKAAPDDGKLKIVAVNFPGYDFARQVCGNRADITMLLPPGGDSHFYEPTPQDIIDIQSCDLFIYTGGESDTWVDEILASSETAVPTVKMIDCVDAVYEEEIEGATSEHEDHSEESYQYDEHVWTSPLNAIKISEAIKEAVIKADDSGTAEYEANYEEYTEKLKSLDKDFSDFWAGVDADKKVMVFGDRFPLRYYTDRYGVKYYAAFPGCASQTEPSAATMVFLQKKIKELDIRTVFYIEFSNHSIADALAEATGATIAQFKTCHNVSKEQFESGITYIDLMEENLETLKKVL